MMLPFSIMEFKKKECFTVILSKWKQADIFEIFIATGILLSRLKEDYCPY